MPTIDENTGTSAAPTAEVAAFGSTTTVVVKNDTLTPAGQTPTAYLAASAAVLGTVNIYSENGAQVFVTEPLNLLGAVNLYADGGTINLGSTAVGALGNTQAVIENGGTLVSSAGTLVGLLNGGGISFGSGGGTLDISSGASLLNLSGAQAISGFKPGDTVIDGDVNYANVASYSIANSGGNQVVTFLNGSGTSLGSLTFIGGTFSNTGTFAANTGPLQLVRSSAGDVELLTCFLAGTQIATANGDVPVETIRPGDLVETLVGGNIVLQPVTWVGRRTVVVDAAATDDQFPVRIKAGAVADDCPRRDLLVTSDHCIFIDGLLVPARLLVNGGSIMFARDVNNFTYFHVELHKHAILRAENLTSESYLDTGNRATFDAAVPVVKRRPKDWVRDGAAPLAVDQPRVELIWRRLRARAAGLGLLDETAAKMLPRRFDVHLLTQDGLKIRPYQIVGETYGFALPADVSGVRLMSKTARPCDILGPFVDDRRSLGLLVGGITLLSKSGSQTVTAHLCDAGLAGWHEVEEAACRWTSGRAELPLDVSALAGAPGLLKIEILNLGPVMPAASPPQKESARLAA